MTTFLQLVLSGLGTGSIYALVAVGIVLIYKTTRVFNFAQGQFLMFGAFLCWGFLLQAHFPIWLGLLSALGGAFFIGLASQRFFMRPLISQSIITQVVATLALGEILAGTVALIWGGVNKTYPEFIPKQMMSFAGVAISQQLIWSFILCMGVMLILILFFQRTRMGLIMRATAEDAQLAQSTAVSVRMVYALSWAIAALVATTGGILLGTIHGVNLFLFGIGLKAFPAVLVGGLESIGGTIIAALLIGILESLAGGYINPLIGGGFAEVFPYIILIIVLMFRPYGLFGLERIERV